jgi:roadblock/LC7 domain-containing protein
MVTPFAITLHFGFAWGAVAAVAGFFVIDGARVHYTRRMNKWRHEMAVYIRAQVMAGVFTADAMAVVAKLEHDIRHSYERF